MRRSKEIIVLLVLLAGMMGFVLWYVIDRRAHRPLTPGPGNPPARDLAGPGPDPATGGSGATHPVSQPPASPAPVDLAQHDGKTIDFSSGQPVVKDSAEDQAAIQAALKDMNEAAKDTTFEAPKKNPEPGPAPAGKK